MSDALPSGGKAAMRFLSIFLPRLSTDRLIRSRRTGRRSDAHPEAASLAVIAKIKNALRVVAIDRIAEHRGVRIDASLADARGAAPDLDVVEADEAADRALLEKIADWCDRYTPLVALDPPHGLILDISGCAHLFAGADGDGEAELLSDCLRRLSGQQFEVRAAIASTIGAAWALARYGEEGSVPAGAEAEAVTDLPVAALRISAEDEVLLDRLGLKRIGQLLGKPRAPLAARFGTHLVMRLDQALGHLDEVLSPRRPPPRLSAERRFAEPVVDRDSLLKTVASLACALVPALERSALGARFLEAAFFRIDGEVTRIGVGTASPLRAADSVAMLFAERLTALESEWDAGFGFDMLRLAVLRAEPLEAEQIDLSGEGSGGTGFARLIDRLGARLGSERVTRFMPVDTHIPERAVISLPLTASAALAPAWPMPEHNVETPPARPLRLFARPERIEVMAAVPEGPPLRFRWRRMLIDVLCAEGPERIAPEWWNAWDDGRGTRDYFRVEDADGRRYWLFREGLYGRETARPDWYVHGLFA